MRYEFKKLFSSKLLLIMLALTLGYMVFLPVREVWGQVSELRERCGAYEEVIDTAKREGKTYTELYEYSSSVLDENTGRDVGSILNAAGLLQYVTNGFRSDRTTLVRGMIYQNVAERAKSSPDSYLIRANEKAIAQYNRGTDLEFESTGINSSTYYSVFNYSMWEYVMLALCVMMTVRLFTLEHFSGAYRLVNTSRRTERSLFFRKYAAAVSVAAAVLLIQAVFEIGFGMYVFGAKNFSLPIQQIAEFEYCPYAISIAGFYLLKYFVRLICYTAVISVTALTAVLIKRPLIVNITALVISAGGLAANMALYITIDKSEKLRPELVSVYDRLRVFLPQSLLNIREYLKKFDCFSLFGYPCARIVFCGVLAVMISAGCAFLGYKLSGRIRRAV